MSPSTHIAVRTAILSLSIFSLLALAAPPVPAGEAIVTAEVAKLLASDGAEDEQFGQAISLAGDRLAIGAPLDDPNGEDSGSAYVFERDTEGDWVQVAKLLAPDGSPGDEFGDSVSLNGDRLAIGAPERPFGDGPGAVYIFERDVDGRWSIAAQVFSRDGDVRDGFGRSVALEDDRLAVGADGDDDAATSAGAVYIFERDAGGTWTQVAKLVPNDAAQFDAFGRSVCLDGSRVVLNSAVAIGNGPLSGAAYVFDRDTDGTWVQVAKVVSPGGAGFDYFGVSAAVDGDRLVVGARGDDENGTNSGAVVFFERDADGFWRPVAKIFANDAEAFSDFGNSVSLEGDRAVVTSDRNDDNGTDSGAAYLFERNVDGTWSQTTKLTPLDGAQDDRFGSEASLYGGRIVVTSPFHDDNEVNSGSSYIFESVLVSPQLSISGTCPGVITITSSDTTPRSSIRLYESAGKGSFTFAGGPCEGRQVDLDAPDLIREDSTGFDPGFSILRTVDDFWCGRYLQLIDEKTCLTSEVVQVP